MSASTHADEVRSGERFSFGENWSRLLSQLDEHRIATARESLAIMLGTPDLSGKRFLDIGSGSGLFSLAARQLGAQVHSFDFDPASVGCTRTVKDTHRPQDPNWTIEAGSVLDDDYMRGLGQFDIVYSWGVLHHTGSMWQALEHAARAVRPGGLLFIAIYNDQGRASRRWTSIKRLYNRRPVIRGILLGSSFVRLWMPTLLRDLVNGHPLRSWRNYQQTRGMNPWRDVVDWVGGWPFEVAKPEQIFEFCRDRGFTIRELRTCAGGLGCNEFVFERASS
jgi:2-polyprenyl-3-methyl-5-hydroxy-6-metoxy-1,4-benzoquinol methylase